MKGVAIFSGVNYSGKGTVFNIIQDELESNRSVDFISVSKTMMDIMGFDTHVQLGAADPLYRNNVREKIFLELAKTSREKAIFVDGHFIFEDGEKTDFSPLAQVTKLVVLVRPDPETILRRAMFDDTTHPGRNTVRNIDLVRSYMQSDHNTALEFIESSLMIAGSKPNLLTIRNNTDDIESLRLEVCEILPSILEDLTEGHLSVEGNRNIQRRRESIL